MILFFFDIHIRLFLVGSTVTIISTVKRKGVNSPNIVLESYRLVAFQPAFVSYYDVEQGPIKPMTDKLTGSAK